MIAYGHIYKSRGYIPSTSRWLTFPKPLLNVAANSIPGISHRSNSDRLPLPQDGIKADITISHIIC